MEILRESLRTRSLSVPCVLGISDYLLGSQTGHDVYLLLLNPSGRTQFQR